MLEHKADGLATDPSNVAALHGFCRKESYGPTTSSGGRIRARKRHDARFAGFVEQSGCATGYVPENRLFKPSPEKSKPHTADRRNSGPNRFGYIALPPPASEQLHDSSPTCGLRVRLC